jgi:hypothetical protein
MTTKHWPLRNPEHSSLVRLKWRWTKVEGVPMFQPGPTRGEISADPTLRLKGGQGPVR